MSKRMRGFDKLWRWQVTDELDMPNGDKMKVTARRLTRMLKKEREDYAASRARAMSHALDDVNSNEYKERLLPITKLSTEDLLQVLETAERVQLTAKAQREFLSPSPSDKEDDLFTLKDRLDAMDREDEALELLEKEREAWVETTLNDNMAVLRAMDRDELLKVAIKAFTDHIITEEWYAGFVDGSLKLGIFIGDKPFFSEWPTEADDDLKSKLLALYQDADAASFDFSS